MTRGPVRLWRWHPAYFIWRKTRPMGEGNKPTSFSEEYLALPAAEFEALVARANSSGCSECRRGECSCEEYAVERVAMEAAKNAVRLARKRDYRGDEIYSDCEIIDLAIAAAKSLK